MAVTLFNEVMRVNVEVLEGSGQYSFRDGIVWITYHYLVDWIWRYRLFSILQGWTDAAGWQAPMGCPEAGGFVCREISAEPAGGNLGDLPRAGVPNYPKCRVTARFAGKRHGLISRYYATGKELAEEHTQFSGQWVAAQEGTWLVGATKLTAPYYFFLGQTERTITYHRLIARMETEMRAAYGRVNGEVWHLMPIGTVLYMGADISPEEGLLQFGGGGMYWQATHHFQERAEPWDQVRTPAGWSNVLDAGGTPPYGAVVSRWSNAEMEAILQV